MSFNVSGMEAYVKQNAKQIATKAITSAKTAKMLLDAGAAQVGLKGSATVTTMSNTVTFVDGASCGRVSGDSTVFSDRVLTVKPLRNNTDFCMKDLYQKKLVEMVSKGQSGEVLDSAIYGKIAEERAALIAFEIEKLLWKGDTAIVGADNLKWIDGILKVLTADGTAITVVGADIIAKLQSLASQVDITVKEQEDFRVFIGKDTYDALKLALYNKNMFNPGAELVIPGTDVKLEVVSGLNGTNKAVASRISNFQLGVDGTDESEKAVLKYDEINDKALMDFHFAIGIQMVFPADAYHTSLA